MSLKTITKRNFKSEIDTAESTVLLDFWAPWCAPCRMLSPIIDEIAIESKQFVVGKVNVDEEIELAQKFNVMSIPTLVIIKNGEIVHQSSGVRPKEDILELLNG